MIIINNLIIIINIFIFIFIFIYSPSISTKIPVLNLTAESGTFRIAHGIFSIRVTTANCVTYQYCKLPDSIHHNCHPFVPSAADRSKLYKEFYDFLFEPTWNSSYFEIYHAAAPSDPICTST